MKITPKDIARSLVDTVSSTPNVDVDAACGSAIELLHKQCPGFRPKDFVRLVERVVKRKGESATGLLVVPHDHSSLKAETLEPLLAKKTGKLIHIDRQTEAELIGGAVLLIDHRRIDCSIQGALQSLLRTCLQPLD